MARELARLGPSAMARSVGWSTRGSCRGLRAAGEGASEDKENQPRSALHCNCLLARVSEPVLRLDRVGLCFVCWIGMGIIVISSAPCMGVFGYANSALTPGYVLVLSCFFPGIQVLARSIESSTIMGVGVVAGAAAASCDRNNKEQTPRLCFLY